MAKPIALEFTTTACCRPPILNLTLSSFRQKLKDVKWDDSTLYINIDPAPETMVYRRDEVASVAKRYFGKVIVNVPEKANFCTAVKWCWAQPKGKFFFHLEDDWSMMKKTSIHELIPLLADPIVVVTLRAYKTIRDHRICLSPGLMKTAWARDCATRLDDQFNPEQQLRAKDEENAVGGVSPPEFRGCQFPIRPTKTIVRDLGRDWINAISHIKNGGKIDFTSWIKA